MSRPVSPRACLHCGGPLPAAAHHSRTLCSRTCKEARYRAAKRDRRREEARQRPAPPSIDTDVIAASLTARERAVMATWRDGR